MTQAQPQTDFTTGAKAHIGISFTLDVLLDDGTVLHYPCTATVQEVDQLPPTTQGATP